MESARRTTRPFGGRRRFLPAVAASGAVALLVAACGTDTGEGTSGGDAPAAEVSDDYPEQPVEVIVPFDPGGGADNSQRMFNEYASPLAGVDMPIMNIGGAGGAIGWAQMSTRQPDGYTLGIATPANNIMPPILFPDETGFELDDFTYICTYAVVPDTLYVHRDGPFTTLEELIDYAEEADGPITVSVAGAVAQDSLTASIISRATGIEFQYVPFEGGADSLQGLLSGVTETMAASVGFIDSQSQDLIPLAITSAERVPEFPDIPTFTELGYDVVNERFRTFAGPPGLPESVVDYWEGICAEVVEDPEFQERMNDQGQPPVFLSAEETATRIDAMVEAVHESADTLLQIDQ